MNIPLILIVVFGLLFISLNRKKTEQFASTNLSILPRSGAEPEYEPQPWNDPRYVEENNCYAYLLNDLQERPKKPQPGAFAGNTTKDSYTSCTHTIKRVQEDNPKVYKSGANHKCRPGYYKGYLVLDPGKDYHFYRQDSNGFWSHKPGRNPATNLDASSNVIIDPRKSNRVYNEFQYTRDCSFLCVPNGNTTKTNSR